MRERERERVLTKPHTSGRELAVEALVRLGAGVDALSSAGASPLHYAAYGGHLKATAKLAEYGANLLLPTNEGTLPIVFATHLNSNGHFQTAELLRRLMGVDAPAMDSIQVFATQALHS